jgi:zinc D-Ala-D-Ala carboxypeptidase
MKKWGFLLVFALFLVFIFTILPISQDKIEDQIYEQNDHTAPGNLLLVNSEYTVQQASIKSDIIKYKVG